jgi:hypothetical protein
MKKRETVVYRIASTCYFDPPPKVNQSPNSSVRIVTKLQAGKPKNCGSIFFTENTFSLFQIDS